MFDQLKRIAQQEILKRIAKNALNGEATKIAGEQGVNSIINMIKDTALSGNLNQLTDLFAKGKNQMPETDNLVEKMKSQFQDILQKQGLGENDAKEDAHNSVEDLLSNLQDKFHSQKEEDKGFDLNDLQNLLGGKGGNVLGNLKDLL